jgi:hypothetical protein
MSAFLLFLALLTIPSIAFAHMSDSDYVLIFSIIFALLPSALICSTVLSVRKGSAGYLLWGLLAALTLSFIVMHEPLLGLMEANLGLGWFVGVVLGLLSSWIGMKVDFRVRNSSMYKVWPEKRTNWIIGVTFAGALIFFVSWLLIWKT